MILLAPVGLLILISIIRFFVRNFLGGWYALLFVSAAAYTFGEDSARFAGIHFFPIDLLNICLLAAGAIRSRVWELRFNALSLTVLSYIGIFLFSVARGFAHFGVTTTGTEARGFISEIVAVIYFITVPHDRNVIRKIVRADILFAAFLVGVVALHYAGLPIGVDMASLDPTNYIDRAIEAPAAASIMLSVIFAAFWWVYERRGSRWMFVAASIFTAVTILLQHRTVWAMLVVGVLTAFVLDRSVFRVLVKTLCLSALGGVLVLGLSSSLRARLVADLQDSATNSGTFTWRLESWQRSIEQEGGIFDTLLGQPMGTGYTRLDIDTGTYTNLPPHNELVNQYLRLGVLGTLLLLAIMLRPLWSIWRNDDDALLFPDPAAWVIVTAALFTFGIPYCYTGELVALTAMANGLTSAEFALEQEATDITEDALDAEAEPAHAIFDPVPQA
ncbi:hypothetical protein SAMN05421819_0323 [Bryocella elongata]|uniref:O-antigen ligase n=1 Tax=Bryocella elongata TaxID=863522 RepID=A0A1H5SR23_9BACT|nr:hypothetical protein [Bryocella elongata]SEF53046.1 hypothetical protein SAMN05421819_0323 [Bryocella elongata]